MPVLADLCLLAMPMIEKRFAPEWRLTASIAAIATVWITTAGHTINFREMEAARGWIASIGYSLHTSYLFSIVLGLVFAQLNAASSRPFMPVVSGLVMLAGGSILNGTLLSAPLPLLAICRCVAGFGGGLVLAAAPALHGAGRGWLFGWAGIVLPSMAPPLVASATFHYGWSKWEGAFLLEGVLASAALLAVVLAGPDNGNGEDPPPVSSPVWFWAVTLLLGTCWYLLHWGQLEGWLESNRVVAALLLGLVAAGTGLAFAPRGGRTWLMAASPVALIATAFAGFVQFFNVSDMGVYGGLLVNYGVWERSQLVWPISCGAGAALILGQLLPKTQGFSVIGLLCIAAGMALARERTMGWPYWRMLNQVEFNWFPAPQIMELWLPRFMMGLGTGLTLLGAQRRVVPDPSTETRRRFLLITAQFLGGGISIGILCLCLTRNTQHQYSFVADRGFFQEVIVQEYRGIVAANLKAEGFHAPAAGARSISQTAAVYEANNLVFASIYGTFTWAALGLAAMVAAITPAHRTGWCFSRGPRS